MVAPRADTPAPAPVPSARPAAVAPAVPRRSPPLAAADVLPPAAPVADRPAPPPPPAIASGPLPPLPAFALPLADDDVRAVAGELLLKRTATHRKADLSGIAPLFAALPPIVRGELTRDQKAALLAAEKKSSAACTQCKLCKSRTQVVFADGDPDAEVLFIGEGPGADEDAQGLPFVGRAGRRLNDIIEKGMKLSRAAVYICNIVKCRPPENRIPDPDEAAACRHWLERQIEIVAPRIIVLLGGTALKGILGYNGSMASAHGRFFQYRGIPVIPTYHPSWLIRSETEEKKRIIWGDFKQVIGYLAGKIPGPG